MQTPSPSPIAPRGLFWKQTEATLPCSRARRSVASSVAVARGPRAARRTPVPNELASPTVRRSGRGYSRVTPAACPPARSERCRSRSDVSNGIVIVRLEPIQKLGKNPRCFARLAVSARLAMPIPPMTPCWTVSTPAASAPWITSQGVETNLEALDPSHPPAHPVATAPATLTARAASAG